MKHCLVKYVIDSQPYFGLVQWNSSVIQIKLTDRISAWKGEINKGDLHKMAQKARMEFSQFAADAKAALILPGTDTKFKYELADQLQFVWRKSGPDESIQIRLGEIQMEEEPLPDVLRDMLDYCVSNHQQNVSTIEKLQQEKESLLNERDSILAQMKHCVQEKEDMETDLYMNFISVLNAKKMKIRELKSQQQQPAKSTLHSSGNISSDFGDFSDDAYDIETDEEYTDNEKQEVSNTTKTRNSNLKDKDDLLGLGEFSSPQKTIKRTARVKTGAKVEQVLLPYTETTNKQQGTSSGAAEHLNRSASTSSFRSVDSDELMENL